MRNEANIRNHANGRISTGQNSFAWRRKIHEIGHNKTTYLFIFFSILYEHTKTTASTHIRTEYLKLLRFIAWKLILNVDIRRIKVNLKYCYIGPLSSNGMDSQNMGMEDTSGKNVSEAQSNLEREEKQSVQGYIAIKGTRNGLLLTLEPETPFSELLNALSQRLSEAPGFFRGASLAL